MFFQENEWLFISSLKKIHEATILVFSVDDFTEFRNPFIQIFEKLIDILIVCYLHSKHISFRHSLKCVNY